MLDQRVECPNYSLNITDQQNWWISNSYHELNWGGVLVAVGVDCGVIKLITLECTTLPGIWHKCGKMCLGTAYWDQCFSNQKCKKNWKVCHFKSDLGAILMGLHCRLLVVYKLSMMIRNWESKEGTWKCSKYIQ